MSEYTRGTEDENDEPIEIPSEDTGRRLFDGRRTEDRTLMSCCSSCRLGEVVDVFISKGSGAFALVTFAGDQVAWFLRVEDLVMQGVSVHLCNTEPEH